MLSTNPIFRKGNVAAIRERCFAGTLGFSALHQQVRQRRALAARYNGFETIARATEFEQGEQFVLDEVLQLVAERALPLPEPMD